MQLLESELAADSILPVQLYGTPLGGARIQPEKRLQVAVLFDAVLTFQRCARDQRARSRRIFVETEAWFASDDAAGPFAFISICHSLQLDPSYIRRGLRQLQARLEGKRLPRRDSNGARHQVVAARLRRVA